MEQFVENLKPKEELTRKDKENLTNLRMISIKTYPEYWDKPFHEKAPGEPDMDLSENQQRFKLFPADADSEEELFVMKEWLGWMRENDSNYRTYNEWA